MNKAEQEIILNHLDKLTKVQIVDFGDLPKFSCLKSELIQQLQEKINGNEVLIQKLYKQHKEQFTYNWRELEETLQCTKTERIRWTKEEKIEVGDYEIIRKAGRSLHVPHYDILSVHHAIEKIPAWRKEHEENKVKRKKEGINKTKETKAKQQTMREDSKKHFRALLVKWHSVDGYVGASFELAFWTTWINRWAKEFQLKKSRCRSAEKEKEYEEKISAFYQMKESAIKALVQSPFASLSFYRSDRPHKVDSVHFCEHHFSNWCDEREFGYISKWDYFWMNESRIKNCSSCQVSEIQKDYYSLYVVEIKDPRIQDHRFCFHLPYPIGEPFMPSKNKIKRTDAEEQQGMFRFGRPLVSDEKIVYTEKRVQEGFQEALRKMLMYNV